jgi:hypothetical protein
MPAISTSCTAVTPNDSTATTSTMITDSVPHYRLNAKIIATVLKAIFKDVTNDSKFNIRVGPAILIRVPSDHRSDLVRQEVNDVYKFDVPRLLTDV